jgi:putative DNA primase/helicase
MADIPADAGAGLGAFENLHGMEGGSAFAKHITGQAQRCTVPPAAPGCNG